MLLLQEDLFAKICSLSYMGDLRVLVAENKNKACGLLVTRPPEIRSQMGMKLGEKKIINEYRLNACRLISSAR
ncbi:hypothetical protein Pint_11858 [Pistacia integerrima]|uniref:Uncharacterized protein n=1 Tax=Pistacia integerrima TaxID=434235 RepID=A0ACC0XIT3_9ROSI|nr:hypothetical protein Pint_11858 [Pistacia integerrima]